MMDQNGTVHRYEYDSLGRMTADGVVQFGAGVDDTVKRIETSYEVRGMVQKVTSFSDASGGAGNILNELVSQYDGLGKITTFAQDHSGAVDEYSPSVGYTYSAGNRLTRVDSVAAAASQDFDELYRYDDMNRLVSLERGDYDSSSDEIETGTFAETWDLDALGNWEPYRYDSNADGTVDVTQNRVHNRANEITSIDSSTTHVAHDAAGNMTKLPQPGDWNDDYALTFDAWNRLVKVEDGANTVAEYAYANGNTTSKATERNGSLTDQVLYNWNYENRLTDVDNDADGTFEIENHYNADGIRTAQTSDGEETRFLIDSNRPYAQVLKEYTPGGIIKVSYVHGLDLISQNRPAETGKSFYHVDGLGSTRALTNGSGLVTDTYIYDAFGRTIGQVGSTGNVNGTCASVSHYMAN